MTPDMPEPAARPAGPSRRTLLRGLTAALPLAAVGGALAALPAGAAGRADGPDARPGLLHSPADLRSIRALVAAGRQPWTAGWDRLSASSHSSAEWVSRETPVVVRGGAGENVAVLFRDIHAAYQNALRWHIGGGREHGDRAVAILNAWSSTLVEVSGNADRFLASGLYGYQFANAAELVRDHPQFDLPGARRVLLECFAPMAQDFLRNHNGAVITNYWANWDLANMCALLAIGAFTDRDDLVTEAIDYFHGGAGNGSLPHAVPFVYEDEHLAQWQESGRDQAHSVLGIGLMGAFCEMAWQRGHDCYGALDDRFLKAAEYVAKYNLGEDVPFTPYTWQSGPITTAPHVGWQTHTHISPASRAHERPVWELIAGHYIGRRGLSAPWVARMAGAVRVEGGGGQYGPNSGGYDQLGFGTLLHHPRPLTRASAVVTSRSVAGKIVLVVTVTGDESHPVTATVASPYGTTRVGPIQPGKKVSAAQSTRLRSIPAGEITVTLDATDIPGLTRTLSLPYGATA